MIKFTFQYRGEAAIVSWEDSEWKLIQGPEKALLYVGRAEFSKPSKYSLSAWHWVESVCKELKGTMLTKEPEIKSVKGQVY